MPTTSDWQESHFRTKKEISREMPFASGDAHSAGRKGSEAAPGAEAFSPFGRLSERSQKEATSASTPCIILVHAF